MPPRDARMYHHDIITAGEGILRAIQGLTRDQYAADEDLRMNVERRFEIIGEALRQAMEADDRVKAGITDARRIVDFRNFLIHGYHLVDYSVVWDIIHAHLPLLLSEAKALLASMNEPPSAPRTA